MRGDFNLYDCSEGDMVGICGDDKLDCVASIYMSYYAIGPRVNSPQNIPGYWGENEYDCVLVSRPER